jgi:hypothetical protein
MEVSRRWVGKVGRKCVGQKKKKKKMEEGPCHHTSESPPFCLLTTKRTPAQQKMSATTMLRASTLAGARLARTHAHRSRASTVRAFAKAASSGSGEHHAPSAAAPPATHDKQQHDAVSVQKHKPAQAPALRGGWPSMMARRPSSLLGGALFGDLDR